MSSGALSTPPKLILSLLTLPVPTEEAARTSSARDLGSFGSNRTNLTLAISLVITF